MIVAIWESAHRKAARIRKIISIEACSILKVSNLVAIKMATTQ